MRVDFGAWMPDQPPLGNPGCIEAKNVIPTSSGFREFKELSTAAGGLDAACVGAKWVGSASSANAVNFAGDASSLYKYDVANGAWANLNTASYNAVEAWEFERFGTQVIACDVGTAPQVYDMASSSQFADLGGSPPQAKFVAVVRDHVVLAHLADNPYRLQWSAFNNATDWTASLATQAGGKTFPGGGGVLQGVVGGEYGVVFQENSIWRMDYADPPITFQFDEKPGVGTQAPRSIVPLGDVIYFYGNDGFRVWTGQGSQLIGENVVDEWFRANSGGIESMVGVADRVNQLIIWAFKTNSSEPINNRLIVYSYANGRWGWADQATEYLNEKVSEQPTETALAAIFPDPADTYTTVRMDSQLFANTLAVQAFDSGHRSGTFDGDALGATLITRELAIDSKVGETSLVRPIGDGGTTTVQLGHRATPQETVSFSNATPINRTGGAPVRKAARYQRYRVNITGGFNHAVGVEVEGRQGGAR